MRLLYRADGGHPIGAGHIYRAVRLINHLSSRIRLEATLAVGENPAALKIAETADSQIRAVPPSFNADSVKPMFKFESVREIIRAGFDLIAVDMLDTDPVEMAALAESGIPVVTFDDRGDGRTWASAVINCLVTEPRHFCLPTTIQLHEGFEFAVLDPIYSEATGSYVFRGGEVERVFVTLGGGDAAGLTVLIANALKGVPGIRRVEFGVGPAYATREALDAARKGAPWEYEVYNSLPNLLDRYLSCDLAIVAGGLTMYEACCVGVPALAVCQPIDHQAELAIRLADVGAMATVGFGQQAGEHRIAKEVGRLSMDESARKALSVIGPRMVDGRGIERVGAILREVGGKNG